MVKVAILKTPCWCKSGDHHLKSDLFCLIWPLHQQWQFWASWGFFAPQMTTKYKDLYMAAHIYCLYLTFSKSCPKCGNIWVILQGKNLVILAATSFSDFSKDFFRRILKFFIWQHCQWLFSKLFLAKNKCWIFIALFIEMIQSTAENFPSLVFNNVSEHK